VIGYDRLLGIGSDYFQIVLFAERKQSVARSASGMDAAERCANTDVFFDETDAAIEIAAAEKNVVEQCGHLIGPKRSEWRGESESGQCEKISARHHTNVTQRAERGG